MNVLNGIMVKDLMKKIMNKENIRKQYNKSKRYFVKYKGDARYEKVWEQMQLLGIEDITTERQSSNGTVVWRLPIKNNWPQVNAATYIEVASFKSGYVRNQNSGYSNYQLNKRIENQPTYYKDYEWKNGEQVWTGKYRKFTTRGCELIPIEIDRLEYLISYCLKNYYIKRANEVANGEFVPKWQVESQDKHNEAYNNGYAHGLEQGKDKCCEEVAAFKTESEAKILILEKELENRPALDNLSVTVNGERYKII